MYRHLGFRTAWQSHPAPPEHSGEPIHDFSRERACPLVIDFPRPLTLRKPVMPFADSLDAHAVSGRASAALFGAPLDRTTSFRQGTDAGPSGVREISWSLESYSPIVGRDLRDLSLVDLGDLALADLDMDAALAGIERVMAQTAEGARLAVMIGGEHTVSLGGYRGIKRVYPDAALVQLDAHLDIRPEYEGERITHATWVYHAGEEFGFDGIIQLGVRSGERDEWPRARSLTAWSSPELSLPEDLRRSLAGRPIYLTVDIDVLDPAFAPGTGCPEPGGFSFRDVAGFLYSLADLTVVAFDVVEVAPNLDHSGITSVAAAKLIREAILQFGVGE